MDMDTSLPKDTFVEVVFTQAIAPAQHSAFSAVAILSTLLRA
jgi:hypothetical protein